MKLFLSGGYNSDEYASIAESMIFRHGKHITAEINRGAKTAVVNLAKPVGYQNQIIRPMRAAGATVIERNYQELVKWDSFDQVIMCGGGHTIIDYLDRFHFDFDRLSTSCIYYGDSAGAKIFAPYYIVVDEKGKVSFEESFADTEKHIIIAHADRSAEKSKKYLDQVNTFAKKKKLEVILLKENEERAFER